MDGLDAPPLPANLEAEQALLGAILVQNRAYDRVADFLKPEHFFEPVHRRIYAAIAALIAKGQIANPVTLKNTFDQDGALAEIGGAQYLVKLAASVITIINAADYGCQIVETWCARQVIAIGTDMATSAVQVDIDHPIVRVIEDAQARLLGLAGVNEATAPLDSGATATRAVDLAEAAWRRQGKLVGVSTGLDELDKLTGGLRPGDLVVIGGRSSHGKTALADGIAVHAARGFVEEPHPDGRQRVALVIELEMTAEGLGQRRLAARSGIAIERIRNGWLEAPDFDRLLEARDALATLPLLTLDKPGLTLAEIRRVGFRLPKNQCVGLVAIDHLGLVTPTREARRNGETAAVDEIAKGLKVLAKEWGCPVIALSQLNRGPDLRDNHRPTIADLRSSSEIENSADIVLLTYREHIYLKREAPEQKTGEKALVFEERLATWNRRMDDTREIVELIVEKHRMGALASFKVPFDGKRAKVG